MNDPERLAIRVDRVGGPANIDAALTLVLLPPAASTAEDFLREGFVEDLNAYGIAATIVRSEIPVDMYAADSMVALLRERVPLRELARPFALRGPGVEWLRNLPQVDPATLDFCATLEPSYPVLFALTAAGSGAGARDVLLSYAFGWAENMMQAALKAVPLGQSAGQRILARLATEIPVAVEHALALHDEDRQAFSPMLAILCSRHETQYSRLFRS